MEARVGFCVRKDDGNKNKRTSEISSSVLVYYKERFRRTDKRDCVTKNPRQQIQTGCGARRSMKLSRVSGKYSVNEFKEDPHHGHVIL